MNFFYEIQIFFFKFFDLKPASPEMKFKLILNWDFLKILYSIFQKSLFCFLLFFCYFLQKFQNLAFCHFLTDYNKLQ